MQFYRLHKQPEISAKMLPDYALKLVNIREGWQIISDCGHALYLSWETQNNVYCHKCGKICSSHIKKRPL